MLEGLEVMLETVSAVCLESPRREVILRDFAFVRFPNLPLVRQRYHLTPGFRPGPTRTRRAEILTEPLPPRSRGSS